MIRLHSYVYCVILNLGIVDLNHIDRCASKLQDKKICQKPRYIISFDVNEQLTIKVKKMCEVKEGAHLYIQRRLVNVTRPDKGYHNTRY